MAGLGVKLNRIFDKNTITTDIIGMGYASMVTVSPMILVILAILISQTALGFSKIGYAQRELLACTILYIFIFALLTASPFNSVLSRYLSDVIYEERFEDIMPCFHVGMVINIVFSSLFGIPFCLHEYFVGEVSLVFVFAGYCGYMALILVFYAMLYLSICKDYKKISLFFLIGMLAAILLGLLLKYFTGIEITLIMLISLDVGFLLIAALEIAVVRSYFQEDSGEYKAVLYYFRRYWKLVATNFLYTLGLYIHNFVFWTTDYRMVVAKSFVCMTAYDMATCLAMFTNISATVIFISRVEMHFHERYKTYSEAVIGGRYMDIQLAKKRMFRQLSEELMNLVRVQFIISVVIYFICVIFLTQFSFGGMVMKIYPCLAAAYFILFIMYSAIIFLYYFNDLTGAMLTAGMFCLGTGIVAFLSTYLTEIWFGAGVLMGSFLGWGVSFLRMRWLEDHLDDHIFCRGTILKKGKGKMPSSIAFNRYDGTGIKKEDESFGVGN